MILAARIERETEIAERQSSSASSYQGLVVALAIIYVSPFISSWLNVFALVLLVWRVIKNDVRSFSIDYCVLVPVALIFRIPSGLSLLTYLCVFAALWYFSKEDYVGSSSLVVLILLLAYYLTRMDLQISSYVLCASQLILLRALILGQNFTSMILSANSFCVSFITSSFYALLLRRSGRLAAIRGAETPAYWGSSAMRFQGLYQDPNYYMYLAIVALALLICLRTKEHIKRIPFLMSAIAVIIFGFATYSKTFAIIVLFLFIAYVITQLATGRYLYALVLTTIVPLIAYFALSFSGSSLSVVLYRFTSASNIDELTTGRSALFSIYATRILSTPAATLFGLGFDAPILGKATHNLYLEIAYYSGLVGLIGFTLYTLLLGVELRMRTSPVRNRLGIVNYLVLAAAMLLFASLHGMFSPSTYVTIYLSLCSLVMPWAESRE